MAWKGDCAQFNCLPSNVKLAMVELFEETQFRFAKHASGGQSALWLDHDDELPHVGSLAFLGYMASWEWTGC